MTAAFHTAPRPITIGLMGTPLTSGNRGVLALGAALTRLCLDGVPEGEVTYFGSHRDTRPVIMRPYGTDYHLKVVHWRLSFKDGPRHHLFVIVACAFIYRFVPIAFLRRRLASAIPWIRELEKTAFVGDVRGGDSFSDIYGLKRFLLATLPVLSVLWVKRNLVLFPQTYGPFKSSTSRWIARKIIQSSSTVIARDRESQHVAQQLARTDQKVLLSPDVAFALHADVVEAAQFDIASNPQLIPGDAIGLNVNGLMFNGGYTGKNMFGLSLDYRHFLQTLVTRLLAIHPGPLLLIPHTYAPVEDVESDNGANEQLKRSLPPALQARVWIVTGNYDAHQLKGIIARCSFFVGSRMHSCIAALSQGVPCVGVAYSMKFRGVFETVGMAESVIDGRSTSTEDALEQALQHYRNRGKTQTEMTGRAQAARENLSENFSKMVGASLARLSHQLQRAE